MQLKLFLGGEATKIYAEGRPRGTCVFARDLEVIRRTNGGHYTRIMAALKLVADGSDPHTVAECSPLGAVQHWRWGPLRVGWFRAGGGEIVVLGAVWRKKSQREELAQVRYLENLKDRYEREANDFHD